MQLCTIFCSFGIHFHYKHLNSSLKKLVTKNKMKNLIISRSKLLLLVIYFYRISGITFGGLSLGKNWNIIKSPFWYHFGWLGFVIYSIPIIYMIYDSFSDTTYSSANSTINWVINVTWYLVSISKIWSILIIYHKYGLKILKIFIKHSLTELTKLKLSL